ncbi:hypothetical protein PHYBLDRAFT_153755 [Phycomyces blakesleeanus NRRL 1555(-)]|uniref:Uncharacterized protein n=1 Tax=Phycomyces blakesleeanus (strain ATCC 8743b / DSM 1359 / FGSC 10004 / NBRC 33097 / NRRL 1555) TaxID=763407 RepID=A0A163CRZ5_PHYB8|nr:hypothetical protein PHYBLDRAFT_153755 [Phycomyces blakesleeanus NRRL 1555(-)]OAD65160.1 hypothetical protein PHYBLDRAFT_153755 [Phycomyces blakesleeanus NRRL 1555(-)]|eukprot:XP_018283200.1 hypothetical protein PHYBLDRAFT_153755 [Phycomyces blakesleeanus NRRL 1555(-)]
MEVIEAEEEAVEATSLVEDSPLTHKNLFLGEENRIQQDSMLTRAHQRTTILSTSNRERSSSITARLSNEYARNGSEHISISLTKPVKLNLGYTTTLQHTNRWNSSRRTIEQISIRLEECHQPTMANNGSGTRLPNTMDIAPHCLENQNTVITTRRSERSRFGGREIQDLRCDRNITDTERGLPIPILYCQGSNQMQTHPGLQEDQPVYPVLSLQDGRCTCPEGHNRARRLDDQDRSKRCIHCRTNTQGIQTIPHVQAQEYSLPVQISTVWNECGPESILKAHAICDGTSSEGGNTPGILLGRHLYFSKNQVGDGEALISSTPASNISRISDQLAEECINTFVQTGIPRLSIQHQGYGHQSSKEENDKLERPSQTGIHTSEIVPMDCQLDRENDGHDSGNRGVTAARPVHEERFIKSTSSESNKMGSKLPFIFGSTKGVELVGRKRRSHKRIANQKTNTTTTNTHNTRRRIRLGLGSLIPDDPNSWILDKRRKRRFDQCQGAEDNLDCTTTARKKIRKLQHNDILGQHNSTCEVL